MPAARPHDPCQGGGRPNQDLMYSRFYAAADEDFRSPACRRLIAYWRDKAAGRRRPDWTALNLMDVYDIAPMIMVRDVLDRGREYRCRFCGTRLVETLGVDPTGKLLADTYSPEGQNLMHERYGLVLKVDAPVRLSGYLRVVEKNVPTGYEGVLLPLGDGKGALGHIILVLDLGHDPATEGILPTPAL